MKEPMIGYCQICFKEKEVVPCIWCRKMVCEHCSQEFLLEDIVENIEILGMLCFNCDKEFNEIAAMGR